MTVKSATVPPSAAARASVEAWAEEYGIPRELLPNYDEIISDDGAPVDSIFQERQMRLLVDPLYTSWHNALYADRFIAAANVGLFYRLHHPPIVPDVLVPVGIERLLDPYQPRSRTYFVWEYGKPPDVVIEIVSKTPGEELSEKLHIYEQMHAPYYVVYDPEKFLKDSTLYVYELHRDEYIRTDSLWFSVLELGLTTWTGRFQGLDWTWLRWSNAQGELLPTGPEGVVQEHERAEHETARAERERARAERETARAERLAAKLRALGAGAQRPAALKKIRHGVGPSTSSG